MNLRRSTLALAAATTLGTLAACGGGTEAPTTQMPAAAAAAMRLKAQAVRASAVSPDEAARQLMDFAETTFPEYFPEHQATLTFGPFRYRAYSTGVLLGVVVSSDPAYVLNGVYVMGGTFGSSPLYVGMLTQYITPVDPDPGPGPGANNGCYDLGLLETQGTRLQVNYRHTGFATGDSTTDSTVGGLTTYQGRQARESQYAVTSTLTASGVTTTTELSGKSYELRTGDAEVTHFGSVMTGAFAFQGMNGTTTTQLVFEPPWVDQTAGLALGASYTYTESGTTTVTTSIPGFPSVPQVSTFSSSETVRFAAREQVTVPAGTYATCKFEYLEGATVTSTHWVIDGKGIPVKMVDGTDGQTSTQEATEVKINGSRI